MLKMGQSITAKFLNLGKYKSKVYIVNEFKKDYSLKDQIRGASVYIASNTVHHME